MCAIAIVSNASACVVRSVDKSIVLVECLDWVLVFMDLFIKVLNTAISLR